MRTLISLLLLPLAFACTAGVGPDKGDEEAFPVGGKADSFRNPTEHGQLRFGTASRARLGGDARFHAWTFSLTGEAPVSIEVTSSLHNLDTVMYLYHRDDEESRWGRYIARNDDYEDSMQSKIVRELGEGYYRIIVKGYKGHHEGAFAVTATCEGRGCAQPETDPIAIPPETGFTHACVNRLWDALGSPLVSRSAYGIHPSTRAGHDRAVLVATAHYDGLSDWSEYVYEDERDEYTFDVELWTLENGAAVVEMSDGGDESTTDYAFDAEGNLLAYYVHNQSPWAIFYCGDSSEDSLGEPHEDCVSAWMNHGPRAGTVTDGVETYVPEEPNDEISALMQAALDRYFSEVTDGEDVEVRIEFSDWEGPDGGAGSDLLLSAEGHEMVSYTAIDGGWGEPWLVFESSENDDEGPHMTCERAAAR